MFVVQAQAGEMDVRAEVSMPAPITTAEHARNKPRPDKVRKPAFENRCYCGYRHQEKAPCCLGVPSTLSDSLVILF